MLFYIDLEKGSGGTLKEILLIRRNDSFSDLLDGKIRLTIMDQIEKGNRKWLKDNSDILKENEFTTMRHHHNKGNKKYNPENKNDINPPSKTDIKSYLDRIINKVLDLKAEEKKKEK